MKKYLSVILLICLCMTLFACGNDTAKDNDKEETTLEEITRIADETATQTTGTTAETKAQDSVAASKDKTLVVYFSATGTTEKIAGYISTVTGGDKFEIVPVKKYTSDDLNYSDKSSRSTKEQNDKSVRPEISNKISNWDEYSTVFVGFPIWWGEEPRIMDTFVESYDFTGKNVVPFCTSASSGFGNSGKNLESLAKGSGKWIAGTRIDAGISHSDMCTWVNGLGLGYNAK